MSKISVFKTTGRLYLLLAALFLVMAGCNLPDPFYVRVTLIEGVPERGEAGTPLALTGNVRPAFASNKDIVWSVKNAGTTGAGISGNILNAGAGGTVTVRAVIKNGIAEGKDFTQDFTIVFTAQAGTASVPVTGVTLNKTALNLDVGATETLTATISPDNATNKAVTWSTSNPAVATVIDGAVTAVSVGTANITVTTMDGGFTATCAVTVSAAFDAVFNSIAEFAAWLAAQPPNSAATAYHAKLNLSDLCGYSDTDGSLGYALLYQNPIKYVSIDLSGSTITSIEDWAFDQCENLTGITIPDSVTVIERGAFNGCSNLTSITIPSGVTGIGDAAFADCASLESVTIGNRVTSIGNEAFSNCTNLTSVTFQGTIASSGFSSGAFYQLGDLRIKFYASNTTNGTPGTYTTTSPVSNSSVWTKQS